MMRIIRHSRVFFDVVTFNYGMNYHQISDKGIASLASWLRLSFARFVHLCLFVFHRRSHTSSLEVKL
jgi:hypothetical protein